MFRSLFFGNTETTNPPPDYVSLSKNSQFTKGELKHLFLRFNSICNQETRVVEKLAFLQQPELAFSPLISLAYDMEIKNLQLAQDQSNTSSPPSVTVTGLNFEAFVQLLSVFSQKSPNSTKLSYFFDLIDRERENYINKEKYQRFLTSMSSGLVPLGHFEDEIVGQMWAQITKQCGSSNLTRDEFRHFLCQADLDIFMTISF